MDSSNPIIPFIEGDGTGPDIWRASRTVFDAAIARAYGGSRRVAWYEVLAGEKAFNQSGEWLPTDTLDAIRQFHIAIKGPLTTPVGGGIRSLNVTLRQFLDLYVCMRPVRYYAGVPSPMKHPERLNVVIFRENTEDVYAGIEWRQGTPEAKKVIDFLNGEMGTKIRPDSGIGIKPMSVTGSKRLIRRAIHYALENGRRKSVTLVHKGQHHEVHRRRLPRLGLRTGERGVRRRLRHRSGRRRQRPPESSWSRTASRTPSSSRCSCGPTSTMCWPRPT